MTPHIYTRKFSSVANLEAIQVNVDGTILIPAQNLQNVFRTECTECETILDRTATVTSSGALAN